MWRSTTADGGWRPGLAGVARRRLVLPAVTAGAAGLADATALLTIAHVAVTVSVGDDAVGIDVGPLDVELSVTAALVAAVALLAVRLVAGWVLARTVATIGAGVLQQVRRELVGSYLAASWPVQASVPEGRLAELLSDHSLTIARGATVIAAGVGSAASFVALVLAAVVIAPVVSVVALAVLGGLLLLVLPRLRSARSAAGGLARSSMRLAESAAELSGVSVEITAFGVGDEVRHRLQREIDESGRRFAEVQFVRRFQPHVVQTLGLAVIVTGLVALAAVDRLDVATAGASVAIVLRALLAAQPMHHLLQQVREVAPFVEAVRSEQARLDAARVADGGEPVGRVGALRLEGVAVRPGPGRVALREVDLEVAPGEIVGVTGPSGSGKTTLLQVLVRLRQPDAGVYRVDGRPAHDLDRRGWCRRVAFVPQESRLLGATVLDTLRFLRDRIGDEELTAAARLAHVDDDVASWPGGYAAVVGPRSATLSGGERQRLSLARALAGEPDLLVLDEPTSALDRQSEALVRDTLAQLRGRTTVVIVAHRLSTLQLCDRIVVLEAGRITAVEQPDALAAASPFYREAIDLGRWRSS